MKIWVPIPPLQISPVNDFINTINVPVIIYSANEYTVKTFPNADDVIVKSDSKLLKTLKCAILSIIEKSN